MATNQPEEKLGYDDFVGLTVASLKDFLAIRGLNQSGKKVELVARAFGAYELGAPKKFTQQQIYEKINMEYSRRLTKNGMKTDPNTIEDVLWEDNIQAWPLLDDGKLFSYILRVKAVDVEYIGKYKDQKAYSYWMSGFVDTVYTCKCPLDKTLTFLRAKVCPSQRVRDDPHNVWVCVKGKEDCSVVTSWCTCIAGTGEVCNHVIAVLYKVNYAFTKQYISAACTSVPQGWNKGTRKEVKASKLRDLTFRKDKKTRKETGRNPDIDQTLRKQFDPRKPEDRALTNDKVSALLNSVKKAIPSACLLLSVDHSDDDGLPLPLVKKGLDIMSAEANKNKPLGEVVPIFIEKCQMTPGQVEQVEVATRGQHLNNVWKEQRVGRITASNFHSISTKTETILKSTRSKKKPHYSPQVSQLLGLQQHDISHLPQISWGVKHESDAIKSFMSDVASQHEDGLQGFQQCGLFVNASYPYLAASPDGLFRCKCCGNATIEVKCPYSVRTENILEKHVYTKVEFLEDNNGQPRLKRIHKYYTQVQAQMWVCKVSHCFFIVWTEGHKPFYEKIDFDASFCEKVVNNLTIFYKTYVLPCLLGFRNISLCPKCEKVILEEAEVNDPSEKNVSCEACHTCWHLPCAGLTAVSEDLWLCFACLADTAAALEDEQSSDDELIPDNLCDEHIIPGNSCDEVIPGNLCGVCHLADIPVGGEHVCSQCGDAVHAWCSNHEDITSSADLICHFCSSI